MVTEAGAQTQTQTQTETKTNTEKKKETETETEGKGQAASDCPLEPGGGRGSPGSDVYRLVQQGEVCPYSCVPIQKE